MNRRDLLKSTCYAGAALAVAGCGGSQNLSLLTPAQAQTVAPPNFSRTLLDPDNSDEAASYSLLPSFGPIPYLASNGKMFLSYEIAITSISLQKIRIDKIQILDDADRNRVPRTIEGDSVSRVMMLAAGGADINELESSQAGTFYLDAWYDPSETTPGTIVHRIWGTNLETGQPLPTVTGARMRVRSDIVVPIIKAPAKGPGWVCAEACCGRSHHRRTPISLNGEIYITQRYAIDFIRITESGRLFDNDGYDVKDWYVYGAELLAVADGVVISARNDLQEWVPGSGVKVSKAEAAGNHVLVDMGNGVSYVFCHMQPGSVRVKVGDRVTAGQILGLVGNSGATDAPHLHMHMIGGLDVFQGRSMPWAFERFTVKGYYPSLDEMLSGDPVPPSRVDEAPYRVENAYPLELRIIDF